jgi:hypothetical protein
VVVALVVALTFLAEFVVREFVARVVAVAEVVAMEAGRVPPSLRHEAVAESVEIMPSD